MIALLNFILVVIFVAFIVVCVVAFRIVRSFRSMAKRLRTLQAQADAEAAAKRITTARW